MANENFLNEKSSILGEYNDDQESLQVGGEYKKGDSKFKDLAVNDETVMEPLHWSVSIGDPLKETLVSHLTPLEFTDRQPNTSHNRGDESQRSIRLICGVFIITLNS